MSRSHALFVQFVAIALLLLPATAHASNYQQCAPGTTCTIGEFLYDDDYAPMTSESCTLTAKYPDGSPFLTSQAMTDRGDGWYSYDATLGTTEGLYTATICCTPDSGTMCLDKSFEIKTVATSGTSLTAEDIWSYSNRTLTSYGSLISDIWGYSTRSLTTMGSVASDVWGYSSRTMTSFGTLVADILGTETTATGTTSTTPATITNVVAEQQEQRVLLEKLVNTPIVSLSLQDGISIPDLETKLDESHKQAGLLYDTLSSTKSRLLTLDTKWNKLSKDSAMSEITVISRLIQEAPALTALTKAWDTPTITALNQEASLLKTTLASLLTTTSISKGALSSPALTASLERLSAMEEVLGDATSQSDDATFYGFLASVRDRDKALMGESQKLSALLENLDGQGASVARSEIEQSKDRLLALNEYPGGESLASPAKESDNQKRHLKNTLFSLQGLIGLNRQLLAVGAGDPIRSLWLEEGSIIFRAVITNPSSIISQSVPLKFYLPRELKTEDIIDLDQSLSTTYDSTEEALYASGTYSLKPGETKLVFVEVQDVWELTSQELATLRSQAENLLKPLEKTAYFSQGTTLKSDIDITLAKIEASTSKAVTPENRIRTYREAQLELTKVSANMNRLEDLVAQASGTGSLFGFVGGIQTVAVWGIILVVVAGFIFLSLYFKRLGLHQPRQAHNAPQEASGAAAEAPAHLTPLVREHASRPAFALPALIALIMMVTAGATFALTKLAGKQSPAVINQVTSSPSPLPSSEPSPSPSSSPARNDILIKNPKDVLGTATTNAMLVVPTDSSVNVRNAGSSEGDIVMAVTESVEIFVFAKKGDWSHIGFDESDKNKAYWVSTQFIEPSN